MVEWRDSKNDTIAKQIVVEKKVGYCEKSYDNLEPSFKSRPSKDGSLMNRFLCAFEDGETFFLDSLRETTDEAALDKPPVAFPYVFLPVAFLDWDKGIPKAAALFRRLIPEAAVPEEDVFMSTGIELVESFGCCCCILDAFMKYCSCCTEVCEFMNLGVAIDEIGCAGKSEPEEQLSEERRCGFTRPIQQAAASIAGNVALFCRGSPLPALGFCRRVDELWCRRVERRLVRAAPVGRTGSTSLRGISSISLS